MYMFILQCACLMAHYLYRCDKVEYDVAQFYAHIHALIRPYVKSIFYSSMKKA